MKFYFKSKRKQRKSDKRYSSIGVAFFRDRKNGNAPVYRCRYSEVVMAHKVTYFTSIFILLLSELAAFQRSAVFDAKENRRLDGSVLRERRGSDSLTCAHWCLSEPLCTSFNYQISSGQRTLCELKHASQNDERSLRTESGWLHGALILKTQKKKKKPKGSSATGN